LLSSLRFFYLYHWLSAF